MNRAYPSHGKGIRDERAMAPEGVPFRAHYRHFLILPQLDESDESRLELVGLHVIGKAAEAEIPPASVPGIIQGTSESSKLLHVDVFHSRPLQRIFQRIR